MIQNKMVPPGTRRNKDEKKIFVRYQKGKAKDRRDWRLFINQPIQNGNKPKNQKKKRRKKRKYSKFECKSPLFLECPIY